MIGTGAVSFDSPGRFDPRGSRTEGSPHDSEAFSDRQVAAAVAAVGRGSFFASIRAVARLCRSETGGLEVLQTLFCWGLVHGAVAFKMTSQFLVVGVLFASQQDNRRSIRRVVDAEELLGRYA